jgi:hypothetical protein
MLLEALTRVLAATAAALAAELTDQLLDLIGIPKDEARLARAVLKASTAAMASLIIDTVIRAAGEAGKNPSRP